MLSIVIPYYNEPKTINIVLQKIVELKDVIGAFEIIVVDDGSVIPISEILDQEIIADIEVAIHRHTINQGKGAALASGFKLASGEYIIIQDSDLEYNPVDAVRLYESARSQNADVVIGSRFQKESEASFQYGAAYFANKFLTFLSNICSGQRLTDIETCYKLIRRDILETITIEEKRFGFEPEIIAKLARYSRKIRKLNWLEMPVTYHGRSFQEGKKIGIKDGIRAIICILYYNLLSNNPKP